MNTVKVLVADDDQNINDLVKNVLEAEGWKAYSAFDGNEAMVSFYANYPDLVILDIMMPDIDGIQVCRKIRNDSSTPVIMLTALGNLHDKITCLKAGADDYITKPFHSEELIARAQAVLRRYHDQKPAQEDILQFGIFELDLKSRCVTKCNQEIVLTPIEYNILKELASNAGKVLTYSHLLTNIWGLEYSNERKYLHVYVSFLRKKIEADTKHPEYIITVPGIGYKFQKLNEDYQSKGES